MADNSAPATELDEKLAGLRAELAKIIEQRSAAIVAGNVAEAARLDAEANQLDRNIAAHEEARLAVDRAAETLADEQQAARAERARERLKKLARAARERAEELNEAVDKVGAATIALRQSTKALWEAADGPTRSEALGELPRLLFDLPMVTHERLAHAGVLGSRSGATFDRSAPPPSVAAHLDIALRQISPPPGRPVKE
jgi:hypothetical protein